MLTSPFMARSVIVAVLVGVSAPIIGTYLVQRRLSLLGDGIGHVSLTGVALGWLIGSWLGTADPGALAIPGAMVTAVAGSIIIEVVRRRGSATGDLALALLFYGGIAGGVLLMGLAGGSTGNLNSYLFGSIASVSWTDVWWTIALAVVLLGVGIGLRPALFSLTHDEEFATAQGLPVVALTMLVAITSALTVATAMRVVGVLLVSALMIVPVAVAQLFMPSFRSTMRLAQGLGLVVCVLGLVLSYIYPLSSGATIVVILIVIYFVAAGIQPSFARLRRR
ncbi:metal ABC transporter permease [Nanchangia anserum]|uniref:Metal ABC transporter permease n=2 Tax=Nanchangia anserum TaxID=2692125 RepID=A0A8I0GDX4_9ACTO|nr:metal ABC transporter permease [Nanchangia anserum]MBD3689082.1 metal ABC transporter permease [Nanchangia anserum]QOX82627.1 metal ABC transporter permease [Nanchangia anserum]